MWHTLRMHLTIRKVVELSRPVLISSRNSTLFGPTNISPERSITFVIEWLVHLSLQHVEMAQLPSV